MIKQLTLEEIKKALRKYPSAEPDGDEIVYYLHVTYSGKIVSDTRIANETFTASRDMDEYFDGVPEEYSEDWGASCAWVEDHDDGRVCVTDCSVALDHEQSPLGGLLYIRFEKEEHFILDDDGEIIEDESRTIKFY